MPGPLSRPCLLSRRTRLALGALGLCVGAAAAQADEQALAIVTNGIEADDAIPVRSDAAGRYQIARQHLVALDVPVPADGGDWIALDTLPGVTARLDAAQQALHLDFLTRDTSRNRVALGTEPEAAPLTPSTAGLLLNYDLTVSRRYGRTEGGGLLEARLFSRFGTLSTTGLVNAWPRREGRHVVRLDTTYTVTDSARLRRYSAGDIISGGLTSSRSVRLGGIQVSTDFGIRPDLITYPVPSLSGSAAVPSTVDVLVDGSRVGGGQVAAGDFAVTGTPVINGSGTVDVVVRDALGRQTLTSFNVYGVRTLLARGLSDCTADLGAVRRNYARLSNDYRFAAGTATCRVGVNDRLTLEGHAELARDLALGSGGAVVGLGRFGVGSLGIAASTAATGWGTMTGAQLSLGYEMIARPISFNLEVVQGTRGYRDIAARAGDAPRRSSILALIGVQLGGMGSASLGFTRIDRARSLSVRELAFQQRTGGVALTNSRGSLVTGTYTVSLGRGINLFANAFHDLDRRRSTQASLGVNVLLGPRTSVAAFANFRDGGTDTSVQAIRPVTEPGEFGYRAAVQRGGFARELAEATYRGSRGEVSAGIERVDGSVAGRAGLRGALVIGNGGLLFGNTLSRSFAIVDAGVPGVAVLRENRLAGITNGRGRLLVSELRDFQSNALAIDPLTLPDDAMPEATNLNLRPRDRTGVAADFGVRRVRSARVRFVDAAGAAIAAGERAALNGGAPVPVGYDGEAFLTGLEAANTVVVSQGTGQCRVTFTLPADRAPALIGPLACRP